MKKIILLFLIFSSIYANAQIENAVPAPPNPPKLVNDFTGKFLTPEQQDALEKKMVAYDDSTSNQVAVVIVEELKGYSRDEYAIALGRKWGVGGQKEFSNGIVILVNTGEKGDQRGVFIATGYGLEGVITDLVADQIVQHALIPNFEQGNNYRGLDQATTDIIDAAAGRYSAPEGYNKESKGGSIAVAFLVVAVFLIIIIIISRKGGGGGGYVSRRGYRDGWDGPIIFPGGWGGGGNSGGGGWSGGGGFGGGGFGGGGAGGSW